MKQLPSACPKHLSSSTGAKQLEVDMGLNSWYLAAKNMQIRWHCCNNMNLIAHQSTC